MQTDKSQVKPRQRKKLFFGNGSKAMLNTAKWKWNLLELEIEGWDGTRKWFHDSLENQEGMDELTLMKTKFHHFLGVGTFGRVVLAHDPETEEYYALKVLALYEILEKKQIQNVRNERDALIAGRGHPFIINL